MAATLSHWLGPLVATDAGLGGAGAMEGILEPPVEGERGLTRVGHLVPIACSRFPFGAAAGACKKLLLRIQESFRTTRGVRWVTGIVREARPMWQ